MSRCTTTGCPLVATCPSTGKCQRCHNYFHRWEKRNSPGAMRARRDQLALWDNRLSEMLKPRVVARKRRR